MHSRSVLHLAYVLALSAVCGIGCSDEDDDDLGGGDFYLGPEQVFTGFDGTSTFRVPIVTNLPRPILWTVTDPAVATVAEVDAPDDLAGSGEVWAIVTTVGPGFTTVAATAGDRTLSIAVDATAYAAAATAIGKQRYTMPAQPGPTRVACASCHLQPAGADHTSLEMAPYSDAEVLTVIRTGTYYDGEQLEIEHAWNLTEDEAAGILPYLRSLAPRGF